MMTWSVSCHVVLSCFEPVGPAALYYLSLSWDFIVWWRVRGKRGREMESRGLKERVVRALRASLSRSPCGVTSRSLPDVVREPSFVSFGRHCRPTPAVDPTPQATLSSPISLDSRALSSFWFGQMAELQREEKMSMRRRKKEEERMIVKKRRKLLTNSYGFTSSSSSRDDSEGEDVGVLFSSDEGGAETLLSSRSFSSDSSEFYYYSRPLSSRRKKKTTKRKEMSTMMNSQVRRRHRQRSWDEVTRPLASASSVSSSSSFSGTGSVYEDVAEAVAEMGQAGFAVEKNSNDPREDFRCSMLEMIMEQQIFGVKEMEDLLRSYLSLNPPFHHNTIIEVFSEIRETLFGESFLV